MRILALLNSSALIAAVLWPAAPALAGPCAPVGTNQTCTNSILLSGGLIGLLDGGTLTVTNTNTGTISGFGPALSATGIQAVTAAIVTNSGTISGFGGSASGISTTTATVTNSGTISGTSTGNLAFGFGMQATTVTVTNSGTISGTSTGLGSTAVGIGGTTAIVNNSGTISGISTGVGGSNGFGIDVTTATVTNSGTISGSGVSGFGAGISAVTATVTNYGTITGTALAIQFTGGGGNTLTLGPTSIINGIVSAAGVNNTFQLGGSGSGSFDVSQIGAAAQYQGFGIFQKTGGSTWTLTGTNTAALPWAINAGTLAVNGSMANSTMTVNSGGTLGGTGTVGNTTVNSGGTLSPGNSIGTINVNGNLTFNPGSTYSVEVSPSSADKTIVSGTATLAGTVQASFQSGSYLTKQYTILTAASGLNGTTFSSLSNANLPAGFSDSLSYDPNDVFLNLTAKLGALSTGGLSGNQLNVATALNNFFNNGGALPPNFVNLFGLTGGNLANALSQLSGEPATGAQQGAFQLMNQFLDIMLDPFVDGRGGMGGGPALSFAPEREGLPADVALAYAKAMKAPAAAPLSFERRWGVWAGGYGGSNKTEGDPIVVGSHDVSARTFGGAAGLDYHFSPDTVAGFALAGGGTNWDLAQGLGGGRSDAFQAGVYGATRWGPAYLAADFGFTNHWMSTDRFAPFGDHLTASFNAESYGGRVEGGYRFAMPWSVGITPYAAIQAQSFHTPSYTETDVTVGGFALGYNAHTASDTRSELGSRFDYLAAANADMILILRGRLAWAHDWITDPSLAALFQALPGASFIVNGAAPVKNSALVSVGPELRLANGVSLLAKFEGEFANRAQTYAGIGTLRYTF